MFEIEQMKKIKELSFLGALITTTIVCGCNFFSTLISNLGGIGSIVFFGAISNIAELISIGCVLVAALCFFFIFMSTRTMIDLVTTGFLGAYAGLSLLNKIASFIYDYSGIEFYSLGSGIRTIVLVTLGITFILVKIIYIVRARRTNTFIVLLGVAALLSSFIYSLVVIFMPMINIGYHIVNIIGSLVSAFSSIITMLFFFMETKAEPD